VKRLMIIMFLMLMIFPIVANSDTELTKPGELGLVGIVWEEFIEARIVEVTNDVLAAQDQLTNCQKQLNAWQNNLEQARINLIRLRAVKFELEGLAKEGTK